MSSIRGDQPTEKKYGDLPIKLDIFYHKILIQFSCSLRSYVANNDGLNVANNSCWVPVALRNIHIVSIACFLLFYENNNARSNETVDSPIGKLA